MTRAFVTRSFGAQRPQIVSAVSRGCGACGKLTGATCEECQRKAQLVTAFVPTDGGTAVRDAGAEPVPMEPPVGDAQPAPSDSTAEPAPSGSGSATAASQCNPKGLARADYLKQPSTSTDDFGLTKLDVTQATVPEVVTKKVRGGVQVEPTTAALPRIPSVYTDAGSFVEGTAIFIDQDGTTGCPSGRRLPIRWTIFQSGADKIRDGEQEHCADFQLAFERSLARFATAVNSIAAAGSKFNTEAAAERAVTKRTGAAPSDWFTIFKCLANKTLVRDRRGLHTPKPTTRSPRVGGPCEVRALLDGSGIPGVGTLASADVVKDCNEGGASSGTKRAKSARPSVGDVMHPYARDFSEVPLHAAPAAGPSGEMEIT